MSEGKEGEEGVSGCRRERGGKGEVGEKLGEKNSLGSAITKFHVSFLWSVRLREGKRGAM
jgi:hypothetical protein